MGLDEFDRIKKYFRPLASIERGSLNLLDDAAVLPVGDASKIVISTDALVEGIHFFGEEEVDLIAQKSLRTNLSDMAAMGATPWVYTLSLSLGPVIKGTLDQWLTSFVKGLKKDQDKYDVGLVGGDTVTGSGPTMISITILGRADPRGVITRNGASIYDDIYVSGTIGDSAAGLKIIKEPVNYLADSDQLYLKCRYYLPNPRVKLGQALVGIASAAMDISDGLVQDLGHLCSASSLGAIVNWPMLPLSKGVEQLLHKKTIPTSLIVNGGDDYELLFTAPKRLRTKVEAIAKASDVVVTRIGHMINGSGVSLLDKTDRLINSIGTGFKHD